MTQADLTRDLGKSQSFVSNTWNGNKGGSDVVELVLIAGALELDAQELVGRME